jgi:hypothetical protein
MPLTYSDIAPVDEVLTEVMASAAPPLNLVADLALPPIDVDPKAFKGQIEVESSRTYMGQGHHVNLKRAPGQPYPQLGIAGSTFVPYECQELSGKLAEDLVKLNRAKDPEQVKRKMANTIARALLLQQEVDVATLLFTAGNWGANTSALTALPGGSTKKFGASGAAEFGDLLIAKELARDTAHGANPTCALFGISAFNGARRAAEFKLYGATTKNRMVIPEAELLAVLAETLGVDEVLVGRARRETAATGVASSEADIWTDSVLFFWNKPDVVLMENGLLSSPVSAVAIRERLKDAPPLSGFEWAEKDPPSVVIAGALSRTQVLLPEYDKTIQPAAAKAPRGFLVTDCV